ncbi:MAG TPA: TerC/Alx family metal homeostasis membrane protein [Candidatus Edwardsbacteria bacterium]|nr:TerC/Alx family metal homeostasis membrane protein [Candidatus Edwardsbacteria bacterium]
MTIVLWVIFAVLAAALIWLDLFATRRRAQGLSARRALAWYVFYVAMALLFGLGIALFRGAGRGLEFLTAYIIEVSLSVDNLFVFILIFASFGIAAPRQPRVLKWGILGAIAMRIALILAGVSLLNAFHWLIYVFGAVLIVTAARMAFGPEQEVDTERHVVLRAARKIFPVAGGATGEAFFVREGGRICATALFLVLVMIEFSDLVFAVDSIPAVLAVTRDPLIAVTSNIFAIMGLRALYFVLAGVMGMFRFLKYGVALILAFVGVKMLASDWVHITTGLSLAVICATLAAAVLLSARIKEKH